MIKYALACKQGHGFESWFSDSLAYEQQAKRGLVECPHCGSTQVDKALMAPSISTSKRKARNAFVDSAQGDASSPAPDAQPVALQPSTLLDDKQREMRDMIRDLHAKIAENTVDVGSGFVEEARKMHYGESEERNIRGQASIEETKDLLEEGIEVMPLPVPDALKGGLQ